MRSLKLLARTMKHERVEIELPEGTLNLVLVAPDGRQYTVDLEGNALLVTSQSNSLAIYPQVANSVKIYEVYPTHEPVAFVGGTGMVGDGTRFVSGTGAGDDTKRRAGRSTSCGFKLDADPISPGFAHEPPSDEGSW